MMEQRRRSRESMLRIRWVLVGLGGVLSIALVANGSVLIGALIGAMAITRAVMLVKWSRLGKQRQAAFAERARSAGPARSPSGA
jgi:hypothetical protein